MDRLAAIRLFIRLVECGSFSAVGREAGIGQPAVSKQILALERYLGVQLVLRSSRRVVITPAGLSFYESAKPLADDFDALESSVGIRQHSPRGLVRISTAPAHGRLCITPHLSNFLQRYPLITVELSVSERAVDLIAEGLDLAVRHGPLADSTLTARALPATDLLLVASPGYVASHGRPRTIDDLATHRCIVFIQGHEPRPWAFSQHGQTQLYRPKGSLLSSDAEHIRAAILAGLGLAQVPAWLVADDIRAGMVEVLLSESQPAPLAMHLVYPAGRRIPTRVRLLLDYLLETFHPRH